MPASRRAAVVARLARDVEMEPVQEAVRHRCEENRHHGEERDAAEERVEDPEELAAGRSQRVDGSHPGQDHHRVERRIEPGKALEAVVAERPEAEGAENQARSDARAAQQPPQEDDARREGMVVGGCMHDGTLPSTGCARRA